MEAAALLVTMESLNGRVELAVETAENLWVVSRSKKDSNIGKI